MNKIKKQLSLDLSSVVGFSVEENNFSAPPNSEAGDLALPCFDFAKSQKKNPVELAKEIKEKLNDTLDYLEKVETQGPYLNFTFKTDYLFNEVLGAKNKIK